jgi:myosin heavy subunit
MEQVENKEQAKTVDGQTEDKGEKYSPEQQRLDQEKANFKREREAKEKAVAEKEELESQYLSMSEELDTQKTESNSIKQELAQVKATLDRMAKASTVDELGNLDEAVVDPSVVKHIKKLQADKTALEVQYKELSTNIASLQKTKEQFESEKVQQQQTSYREQRKEAILKDLDDEFGAKYRNEAVDLANAKVKEKGKAPEGEYEISKLIRSCYRDIATKDVKPTTKHTVPVDDGKGGVTKIADDKVEGKAVDLWPGILKKYKTKE